MNDEDWLKKRNYKKGVGCSQILSCILMIALWLSY